VLQADCPNPPGDTRAGTAHLARLPADRGLEHRLIARAGRPNLRGAVRRRTPGTAPGAQRPYDVFPGRRGRIRLEHDPWTEAQSRTAGRYMVAARGPT